MFTLKTSKRILRGKNSVIVPRRDTTRYGLNSFTYSDLQEFKRNLIDVTFDNCRCNVCKFFVAKLYLNSKYYYFFYILA